MSRLGTIRTPRLRGQTGTLGLAPSSPLLLSRRPVSLLFLGCLSCGCGPQIAPPPETLPRLDGLFLPPSIEDSSAVSAPPPPPSATPALAPAQASCQSDSDCGYDPTSARCGSDPRFNKQPPLVDQGIVCYCDEGSRACSLLRVEPVPCEGEESCAVRLDPRPHPVRATAEHPYRKPARCLPPRGAQRRAEELFTTCERTNICTLNRRECAVP